MSHPTDDNRVPGSGNASHNRPDSSEQEIQQILADYGPNGRAPGKQDGAGRTADLPPEAILFQPEDELIFLSPDEEDEEDPAEGVQAVSYGNPGARPRRSQKGAVAVLMSILDGVIPHKGDRVLEIVRKCVFVIALMTLVGSLSYLAYDMVFIPVSSEKLYTELSQAYDPDNPAPLPPGSDDFPFLEGMDESFKRLYMENTDLRGWIRYGSSMKDDFLKIDYPITRGIDNEYYLTHDFYKAVNKNGCVFFDQRNTIDTPADTNKLTIVYGHNMASGLMFAGLNKFVSTSRGLNYIKSAPVITMNTLFEKAQYKVFAVMVVNTEERDGPPFYYLNTGREFSSDDAFMRYVDEIRARSLFDFDKAVDVRADDELLVLSTCTTKSGVHFDDGRLAVVARKVRPGEDAAVDTKKITLNDDVIMPLAWYVNQKLDPHQYYIDGGYTIPTVSGGEETGDTTATTGTGDTTGTATGDDTTTAAPPDTTAPTGPDTTTGQGGGTTTAPPTDPPETTTEPETTDTEPPITDPTAEVTDPPETTTQAAEPPEETTAAPTTEQTEPPEPAA